MERAFLSVNGVNFVTIAVMTFIVLLLMNGVARIARRGAAARSGPQAAAEK